MSDTVIRVENLSKRYVLNHQASGTDGRRRYRRFSEVLLNSANAPWRRLRELVRKREKGLEGSGEQSTEEDFWALKDVFFEIKRGDVVGIVGRNGAGKSTLLKILSRITEPTTGRIEIDGRVASLLEVGTGFHPELTGRENISLNGAILGMTRAEIAAKFDEIVAFAEVEKFLDTPVKRYSSGMYVRLAFAVAAHLEPEILVIDEVLAVGDFAFQKKCLGKMGEVAARDGRTVLFVSHNLAAVRALCSRGILLDRGKILADGLAGDVIDRYIGLAAERKSAEWSSPQSAPGDDCVRLKSVQVFCEGMPAGQVDIQKTFIIAVEYWILEPNTRVSVSFHLLNERDEIVVTGSNIRSMTQEYDAWVDRPYSKGLYRTSCEYPGKVFNDGIYRVTVYINDASVMRQHVLEKEVLSFEIVDTGYMREEYQGRYLGVVRMPLPWRTETAQPAT